MIRQITVATVAVVLSGLNAQLHAQEESVRRLATIATIALDEYSLGVVDGVIVRPAEFDEAQLFLAGAATEVESLRNTPAGAMAAAYIDSLATGVSMLEDPAALGQLLDRFRSGLQLLSGVVLDQYPGRAPSLVAGESLYQNTCAGCHGLSGDGRGEAAVGMSPPPADFTDAGALAGATPLDFVRVIGVGVAGTAMPGFSATLTVEQLWDLALYATSLRHSGDPVAGRRVWSELCEDCLVSLSGIEGTAHVSDDSLVGMINRHGGQSAASETRDLLAFARLAATAEELGEDQGMLVARVIGSVKVEVASAVEDAIQGDVERARRAVLNAYLEFERVEPIVKASSPRTGAEIEAGFAGLRAAVAGGDDAGLRAQLESLHAGLDRGVAVATDGSPALTLFGKSLLIILREGMEAILIVGALAAFLVRAGAPERKAELGWGVLAAVGASVATAAAFATVWRRALASQELIEGVVMLVASGVLFWVSYWLVSKIEMRRWQAFVRDQVTRAVSSGRRFALPAVAFLAVYREGFETVLFYAALYSSADGSAPGYLGITVGLAAGSGVLLVLYLLIQRFGVRIPLKPFFAVTSALLYFMAFSFVGQGITELQASGVVGVTPVSWIPTVPLLGIFPTAQTILIQSALALAVVIAVAWLFWVSPRRVGAPANP